MIFCGSCETEILDFYLDEDNLNNIFYIKLMQYDSEDILHVVINYNEDRWMWNMMCSNYIDYEDIRECIIDICNNLNEDQISKQVFNIVFNKYFHDIIVADDEYEIYSYYLN